MKFIYRSKDQENNFEFKMSDLSKEDWQGVAEDVLAVMISPIIPMLDSTQAVVYIKDNVAELKFIFQNGTKGVMASLTVDEFGCKKDDYKGVVSQIVQLAMKNHFGERYAKALNEKQDLTL